ncbi:rRNA maturation RNase YbeY [Gammaproteobacteria bacterium]|nr:rRNA maturation RNase YbeY [Gammaproteobacteria bacterium]
MHEINVQNITQKKVVPTNANLIYWSTITLKHLEIDAEINIRIVDLLEITELNQKYRNKNKPTNVLSFPFDMPDEASDELLYLGDIVLCAEIINQEALNQNKLNDAHWAHMVIHGTLHLLGYDHENDTEADIMEQLEITILESINFKNPYI